MEVTKRDGTLEHLDLNRFHRMVEEACDGLAGVSSSQVEMNSGIQFYDKIKTTEIQQILVRSASDLISVDTPNYQFVAARLLMFGLNKDVYSQFDPIPLKEMVTRNVARDVYDKDFLVMFTDDEFAMLESFMKFERDYSFTYAGLQQVVDKYLVQNRVTGECYETPQYMYLMIAATLFGKYPSDTRMKYIKKYYDSISTFKISIPTPIMAGVRTPIRQFASCVLIDVGDSMDSLLNSNTAVGKYTSRRAGIGLNFGRVRGINAQIRGGEVIHTGVIPFLKVFEATVKSCQQNGVRGGSATTHFPIFHWEVEDIIVLKNNKGTEDNRIRKLDYSILTSKLFYTRFMKGEDITLFSPEDVPEVFDAFGLPEFDELYIKAERKTSIRKRKISASELFMAIIQERAETGRIYIMNIDHANTHSSFVDPIRMSNLCQEITLPTTPISHIDDTDGEIATCILSALNLGKIGSLDDIEELSDLMVRSLDELIDYQDYPVAAAASATRKRRSLGVGYIGLAHYLAKNKLGYDDPKAWQLVHDTTEALQYYLLKASNNLAMERGKCEWFNRTKYSQGLLPIDHYKKDVDGLIDPTLHYDWEELRTNIKLYGLRNSTLTAQMPSESSSSVSNETNGIEPPRDYITVKKSKKGTLKQVVPGYSYLKNQYTLLWDMDDMSGYLNIVGVMQKFFDQSISTNTSYNPQNYPNNEVPTSVFARDLLTAYKLGIKTLYYHQTFDGKVDDSNDECDSCAI